MTRPLLADGRVRFVGEPVVAVVAETPAIAIDAAERVLVDYEPLPVVIDVERSACDEQLLFPDAGTNHVLALATPGAGRLQRVRGGRRRSGSSTSV